MRVSEIKPSDEFPVSAGMKPVKATLCSPSPEQKCKELISTVTLSDLQWKESVF